MKVKPFADQGHYPIAYYSQVSAALLDDVMPRLSPCARKILCLVIRQEQTRPSHAGALSYAAIKKGTGIASDATISKCLSDLTAKRALAIERPLGYVYLMKDTSLGVFKIGFSRRPVFREGTLQAQKPTIELVAAWPGALKEER